ncbi:MAG: monovalent cation/H(+) antiporter subunit G [Gemmatimonadota bacterium]
MEVALTALTWVFLGLGSILMIVGGVGVLRLPDFFSRMHGAGLTDTMGAGLILIGLMFESGLSAPTVRLVMILLFLWYTSPVGGHALAKAALSSGVQPIQDGEKR